MRTRWIVIAAALALAIGTSVVVTRMTVNERVAKSEVSGTPSHEALYQCSMHPQIVSDRPGICPICQMRLERVDQDPPTSESGAAAGERKLLFYRHPMRPDVTSPVAAKDEMGMDYVPVYEDDVSERATDVPGHAAFRLSTERQQLIGIRKAPVGVIALKREIRAAGRVAYDPKLYQAMLEYREAQRARREIGNSPWPEAREGADTLIRSAALKLRQQGLSEDQIRNLARDAKSPLDLLLPGDSIWVYAQVYEYELDLVRPGQTVRVTSPATPGKAYTAQIAAVDPILDPATRTARVRIRVSTPDHDLRPETFVHVELDASLGEVLAVPESAVLDTGKQQIAFVISGAGEIEPRALRLGRQADGYYEVLAGLTAGEEVVTSANFLIDSESRFRAALAAFSTKPAPGQPR